MSLTIPAIFRKFFHLGWIALAVNMGMPMAVRADTASIMAPLAAAAYLSGSVPQGFSIAAKAHDQGSGFQGIALIDATGKYVVVSFAGTQPSDFNDILADVGVGKGELGEVEKAVAKSALAGLGSESKHLEKLLGHLNVKAKPLVPNHKVQAQLDAANRFFDEVARSHAGKSLSLTGHSLGGYLAQSVASRTGVPAVTFNAPGASAVKKGENHNITNYIREHDVVGMFGTHLGTVVKYRDVHPNLDPRDRYVVRNHSISQFITDLGHGLQIAH